jgi:hypothetical protein
MTYERTGLVSLALTLPLLGCGDLWRPFLDPNSGNAPTCAAAGSAPCDLAGPGTGIASDGGIAVLLPRWNVEKNPVLTDLYAVQFTGVGQAIAVGDQATILGWDQANFPNGWSLVTGGAPAKAYTALSANLAANAWIASAAGFSVQFDGVNKPVANVPCAGMPACTAPFNAVWASLQNGVYLAGGGGLAYRFDLVMKTWTSLAVANNPNENLTAVWGSYDKDVWFGGDQGTLHHYDGTNYAKYMVPSQATVRDIWGNSASNVWAVGDGGLVLRWSVAGGGWAQQDVKAANPFSIGLRAITGNNQGELWAVGDGGLILY